MPVPSHRQSSLAPRLRAGGSSVENDDAMGEQVWVMDETYEGPEKEIDAPSTTTANLPMKKNTQTNLRINTYSQADLHDRYMSSEEEPSPSADSDTESNEEELMHKAQAKMIEATTEPVNRYKTETAIAVPIIAMRPKLVDIINLAPMHKRKRTEKLVPSRSVAKNAASRTPVVTDTAKPLVALEAAEVIAPETLPEREDSLRSPAPDSWLPDDGVHVMQEEKEGEDHHYFPEFELRKAPTYDDYDPYSLSPPRLSPRNSYNTTNKKPGSVTRARNNSNPPVTMIGGWMGLTRSMSLAKRQPLLRTDQKVSKRPKMIARAANAREEPLKLPAFPVGFTREVD